MIATESDTDESSLSSDDSLVNSIIEENIIVEEKMNVSYVTKPEHSNIITENLPNSQKRGT